MKTQIHAEGDGVAGTCTCLRVGYGLGRGGGGWRSKAYLGDLRVGEEKRRPAAEVGGERKWRRGSERRVLMGERGFFSAR